MRCSLSGALTHLVVPGFLGVFLLGCGPDFDPPSELHSLRVLGVQKDVPYAQPGQDVNLNMLWEDASDKAASRKVTVTWSGPCFDPEADLYYACFTDASLFEGANTGDTTTLTMPKDIISRRTPPSQPRNAPYGIAYKFFAVCAGTLVPIAHSDQTAFPIGCQDDAGNLLGPDDFVAGYTSVYSFESFSNHNPVISGFEFRGEPVAASAFCQDAACQALAGSTVPDPDSINCDDPEQGKLCIPTCAADGDPKCNGFALQPTVDKADPANQDQDDVSAKLVGRDVGEQMWIDYYTDAGGFKSPVRLLNDATTGWNDSYGTQFYAPKAPGLARIWAVVHDNRGGMSWAGITLKVQ
jgi:hypothetical protein